MLHLYVQTTERSELMEDTQNTCSQLNGCLFFSSGKLARVIGKTAEEAFKITGLSPSYAFLLHIVNHSSGIHQKKIGEMLHMTPSTITRFVEKLENKGLIERQTDGKNVHLFTTNKGLALQPEIVKAWERLHDSYSGILTPEESAQFITTVNKLISRLEDSTPAQ